MAGGMMAHEDGRKCRDFPAKLTFQVFICCIIAAFGGLMFGYDIGISGGVTSMDDFLKKFFPTVYVKKHLAKENNYCKYDNQFLQLFTSSLYLAAIVCSYLASIVCKSCGRKCTMMCASVFFMAGAALSTFAQNIIMLIFGRVLLGAGVGFGNQICQKLNPNYVAFPWEELSDLTTSPNAAAAEESSSDSLLPRRSQPRPPQLSLLRRRSSSSTPPILLHPTGEFIPMVVPALSSDAIPNSIGADALNLSLTTHGRAVQSLSGCQRSSRSVRSPATPPFSPDLGFFLPSDPVIRES